MFQEFNLDIRYKMGTENVVADALSRAHDNRDDEPPSWWIIRGKSPSWWIKLGWKARALRVFPSASAYDC